MMPGLLSRSQVRLPLLVDLSLIVKVGRTYQPALYDNRHVAVKDERDLEQVGLSISKLKRFVVPVETCAPQPCKRLESSIALTVYSHPSEVTFKQFFSPGRPGTSLRINF